MDAYEALESIAKIVAFIGNLVVLRVCVSAFSRTSIRPLLLIAISAGIAVFSLLIDVTLLRNAESEKAYAFLWTGTTMLWIVDIALYAWGVSGLVAYFLKQKAGEQEVGER